LATPFNLNALTFKHIGNENALPQGAPIRSFGPNSEVHNAGEIWATMLTEVYFALVADPRHTFDEAKRLMADYMVGGLLATPTDGTFTEIRDSLLAFAAASDPADMLVMAKAFARRGAGTAAVSPLKTSTTNAGVVESYELAGLIGVNAVAASPAKDCDGDDNLDAGETAKITVTLTNGGPMTLEPSAVTISSDHAGISFPNGDSAMSPQLLGFATAELSFDVRLAESATGIDVANFDVTATNAGSLVTTVKGSLSQRVNFDDVAASSANDDVESGIVAWTPATNVPPFTWTRTAEAVDNTLWHADDAGTLTDQRLESPVLEVGTGDFIISFSHRYEFEFDGTAWDGGVIEITTNDGADWQDIGAPAGYSGVLTDQTGNPLGGRNALVGTSANYPQRIAASINLGTTYSGQSVKVRFRVGTDEAVGAAGWDIDDLEFTGITNTPFATISDDTTVCMPEPEPEPEPGPEDGGGCGCHSYRSNSSSGSGMGFLLLVGMALIGLRRRREQPRHKSPSE